MFGLKIRRETESWKGYETAYEVLAQRVMVYAIATIEVGDWAAYIDAVPGMNHENEYDQIVADRRGSKLPYDIAKILFPYFDKKYVWRD